MITLRKAVGQYLTCRRSLGYKLDNASGILHKFVEFAEREGIEYLTVNVILEWMKEPTRASQSTWASRIGIVREFACWWSATDKRTQVPPKGLLPRRYRRRKPYIYSNGEILSILRQAEEMKSRQDRIRGRTCFTLFGLIAVTGLRISEALFLNVADLDIENGVLTIRETKFNKTRLVPIHTTVCRRLAVYKKERDRLYQTSEAFFISAGGRRLTESVAQECFAHICQAIGIRSATGNRSRGCGPRIHDLRHTFAARTLINWYRAGINVEREIEKLVTYLGHESASHTYWYLEAVPELMELATERVISSQMGGITR